MRGSYIYEKKSFIDSTYFLICGEVLVVDEIYLDLDQTLDNKITNGETLIGQYIRQALYEKLPDIFVKTELNKIRERGGNFASLSIDNNIKIMEHDKNSQVKLDDNLFLHIRKGIKTIKENSIFGEEDIMKGGRVHSSTTIAKTYCWILLINKEVYNTKVKD
jgi:hypothetical protein